MKLHWYRSKNFGDALSPLLVESLCGERVTYAHPSSAELIAAGSVLFAGGALFIERGKLFNAIGVAKVARKAFDRLRPILNIWGSGFLMDPGASDVVKIRRTRVCAVRGKRSLEILRRTGFVRPEELGNIALGDPGLLFPNLLNERPPTQYDLGIVPHFRDYDEGLQLGRRFAAFGVNVKVIDVMQDDPVNALREIAQCDKILSSSLHGLIVSDALQIPNRHIVFSTLGQTVQEYLFKFDDYYSAFDENCLRPLEASDVISANNGVLSGQYNLSQKEQILSVQNRLLNSFPFLKCANRKY